MPATDPVRPGVGLPFGDLTARQGSVVGDEAGRIAALRGTELVQLIFASHHG